MSRHHIIHDLCFLCSMCTRSELNLSQLGILASILRGDDEASDIIERTGLHYTTVHKALNILRIAGEVNISTKKLPWGRTVKSVKLTRKGLKTIIRFEKAYRAYTDKMMNSTHLRSRNGLS